MKSTAQIVAGAWKAGILVPAFNAPYLPMVEPVIRAAAEEDVFALVEVARVEWRRFESRSMAAVYEEFHRYADPEHVRLHLDHIPVVDELGQRVDAAAIIREAVELGFDSVMVDGSRLELQENIRETRRIVDLAREAGIPCEAELGAVLGHEEGPLPPYEEIFRSGRGFTDPGEAARFVAESGCDWLSVAVGNIHGRISEAVRDKKKVEARLDLDHLRAVNEAAGVPLVLHGGSGILKSYVREAMKRGIAKMNIGADIRQAYEEALRDTGDEGGARREVYARTRWLLRDYLGLSGSRRDLI
jgi:fructose-bisphosphate aldolase class II